MSHAAPLVTLRPRYPGELFLHFRRNQLALLERMAAAGTAGGSDLTRLRLGPRTIYLLGHPELARDLLVTHNDAFVKGRALRLTRIVLGDGLLTSEGPFHRRQRKLVLPAFHHGRIAAYADVMAAYAARRHDSWHDGATLRVDEEMMRLTLEVVAKTLFDADVRGEAGAISRSLTTALEMFERVTNPFAELLNRLPLPSTLRLRRARARLDETIYRLIREHRSARADRGDLLSMLLAAQDEDTGAGMTDAQVRDEAMTLFLAGHETTAVALTWTWYLLAAHPEVEARLHAEVDAVLGDRTATFADLSRLVYTRQVVSESMRLYPPAWAVSREATRPLELGGHIVPRGATLAVCQYTLHRDPRFWKDPLAFRPERFDPAARTERPRFAYLPFSVGVRGCIGEQFAWTEAVLVLATLAQRWRLRRADASPVDVWASITLRPARPVMMVAERRR